MVIGHFDWDIFPQTNELKLIQRIIPFKRIPSDPITESNYMEAVKEVVSGMSLVITYVNEKLGSGAL